MSVVIVLAGGGADRFTVAVPPLAELVASLHVLTGIEHHPEHTSWAEQVLRSAPSDFRTGLRRFTPLWTALRWRAFYPESGGGSGPGGPVAGLSLDEFARLTAYTCASGYHGFAFDRVRHCPEQAAVLRQAAGALPEPHLALAEDLLRDAEALRTDLIAFLDLCPRVYFADLWAGTRPVLARAADRLRRRLADEGPASALMSLSPSTARLVTAPTNRTNPATTAGPTATAGPVRVVLDKVHHAVISPARGPVLLIPTRYGAPHLLVKNEPGLPPVVHFPVDAPDVGATLARSRLLALTDPRRMRLCRLIARQAMTTADLADRLSMTRPQVSRHLRHLRELGLVRVERNGHYVHYALDLAAVENIGRDTVTALQY
ncbi:transcriptional regulator [Parafrankia colletiae]|uniref:Transcriptional regulator n=1 Tax=Parafrankia colletiae TaxID=573497 RepID=A0A1S1QM02_9ACTN|nr:DUF5937 family protein [Parafrankia colletiae]MCK9902840.1 DUF5937 family protein [Frankia sp. Cpl3]OHV35768.1 transcriptional regulator [Parafrankia colletiae]